MLHLNLEGFRSMYQHGLLFPFRTVCVPVVFWRERGPRLSIGWMVWILMHGLLVAQAAQSEVQRREGQQVEVVRVTTYLGVKTCSFVQPYLLSWQFK